VKYRELLEEWIAWHKWSSEKQLFEASRIMAQMLDEIARQRSEIERLQFIGPAR